jgi:hypothetical protein
MSGTRASTETSTEALGTIDNGWLLQEVTTRIPGRLWDD